MRVPFRKKALSYNRTEKGKRVHVDFAIKDRHQINIVTSALKVNHYVQSHLAPTKTNIQGDLL